MKSFTGVIALLCSALLLGGCAGSHPRNPDGAFVGTVERVRSDHLWLNVGNGTVSIDTWSVCGDRTAQHVSAGDPLHVYAQRDWFSYEAWRITTPEGESVCAIPA